ncbi:MAG: formylglycine-generating enzyme family protein, partial [Verrucomicrobia bacterium]|nr:formylglycine-generating enzyme family protein [Verrucomicrobiota bacterium]
MRITIKNISATLAALAVTVVTAQAAAPTLNYEINGNNLVITYTGTLYKSADAITWTEVTSASSPYKIALGDKKQFFCAKASDDPIDPLVPGQDATVSLPGGVTLDLIWIKPGSFMMGSPEDELGRNKDEIQHQVTLTQGYWMGRYEVTQAQYEAVTGENPSSFKGADLPVEQVSWYDAMAFCEKLTKIEKAAGRLPKGYEYTLPTEAQWEYACRAGTTTAFNNGTNIPIEEQAEDELCPNLDEVGWYIFNSEKNTHPAGQKMPNAWRLYDMHGNVFEWCLDWFGYYPTTPVTNPTGPGTGSERIVRGGGYLFEAWGCRSAFRTHGEPDKSGDFLGFRVVLTADPNASKDLKIDYAGYGASENTVILRFSRGLDAEMAENILNYSVTDRFAEKVKVKKVNYEKEKYRVTLSFDKDYDLLFGDVLDVTVSNAVTDTGNAVEEDLTATVNINKYPLKSLYYNTTDISTLKSYVAEGKKADWLEEMPVVDYGQYYSWRCDYLAGWLTAPETGKYSIWFYNDYSGELWLSSDDTKEGLGDTPLIIGTYAEVRSSGLI